MADRIKLLEDVYMPIEGQWGIVAAGTVLDVPTSTAFAAKHISVLSPGETVGALKNAAHSTPIRGLRIK